MGKAMITRKSTGTLRKTARGSGVLSEQDDQYIKTLEVTGIGFRPSVVAAWRYVPCDHSISGASIFFATQPGASSLYKASGGHECWASDDGFTIEWAVYYDDSYPDEPVYWIAIE